jgi:ADP-ribose pyrophosphatase YjhB (NUDIX family)
VEDYKKTVITKIIIQNPDGKVLLFQEPDDHEWMPGHWGLPGGHVKLKESLKSATKRITKEEVGVSIDPLGIYRLEELLDENETIYVYNSVALLTHPEEVNSEKSIKWVELSDVEKMNVEEFSEFFNKKLLLDYLKSDRGLIDFDIVETQEYYDLRENEEYKRWLESGRR